MLEIYDENGHDILNMNDNLTRIYGVVRNVSISEAFRHIERIDEANQEKYRKKEMLHFVMTNTLYDLRKNNQQLHIYAQLNIEQFYRDNYQHDIIVIGGYNNV